MAQILHMLCEGQSIRAITRITGASKNTVAKLLVDAGIACEVSEQGKTVKVIVKKHDGRDYLKTENDRFLPDNLLSLPECR